MTFIAVYLVCDLVFMTCDMRRWSPTFNNQRDCEVGANILAEGVTGEQGLAVYTDPAVVTWCEDLSTSRKWRKVKKLHGQPKPGRRGAR